MSIDPRIDPALGSLLDKLKPFDFQNQALADIRLAATVDLATAGGGCETASAEFFSEGNDERPPVRMLIHRPADDEPLPVYFHIHGGGFVLGNPEMSAPRNVSIAEKAHCCVVSVDYRLAPECQYPNPVEDCYAALKAIIANRNQLGIDPDRIAIGGESAGAGLAAALAIMIRDRQELNISGQLLTYPMLDDRTAVKGRWPDKKFHVWNPQDNYFGWRAMLGHEPGSKHDLSPYAAPARLADFAGLPPTFLAVGALDLFLNENINYANRLIEADVPSEIIVYPGAFHGFILSTTAPVAKRYQRDFIRALKSFLD